MLPEWTNPKLFLQLYGHLGLAFPTPDHCEAKASKATNVLSVGDHSVLHMSVYFHSCRAVTEFCSLSLFDVGFVLGFGL